MRDNETNDSVSIMSLNRAAIWPDRARFRAWMIFQINFFLFFIPAYFGGDLIARWSGRAFLLRPEQEAHAIPFAAWTILIYFSLFPLFCLPLLHLCVREIERLNRQSMIVLTIAFAAFVLWPGEVRYPPKAIEDPWRSLYELLHRVDTRFNAAPSLHVAFAALILASCAEVARPGPRVLYALWFVALCFSTLTTHQHHLVDIASGMILAIIVRRAVPLRGGQGDSRG
jgi:membrane-associated phospholipid phosphatase